MSKRSSTRVIRVVARITVQNAFFHTRIWGKKQAGRQTGGAGVMVVSVCSIATQRANKAALHSQLVRNELVTNFLRVCSLLVAFGVENYVK